MWKADKDEFVKAYKVAMLWANTWADNAWDEEGEMIPLGEHPTLSPTIYDFSENADWEVLEDCEDFLSYDLGDCLVSDRIATLDGYTFEQAGHDFALTRNGHGTGFWDRGLGEDGETLTEVAKTFGEASLWVDADGVVFHE